MVRFLAAAAAVFAGILLSGTVLTAAADQYIVNELTLPLQESGYRAGDYRGAGMCWEFARHIYFNIWGRFFFQYGGSDDDMLREYPTGEARRITAENTRIFITAAPLGAVIRLQEVISGPDSTKCNRHSLILLDKTDTGCTVYHDWSGYATVSTFTWAEFETLFGKKVDFGYFKYIKYPGAKALAYEPVPQAMQKELLISSRIYGTRELLEKKR